MKVRDVAKLQTEDGWSVVRIRGSHKQYKHPTKKVWLRFLASHRINYVLEPWPVFFGKLD